MTAVIFWPGSAVRLAAIDLDDPSYFAEEDLAAYALACLQLAGDERPGNPYTDDALAGPLAARIAVMSGQNFLIAGLIARSHGLHDEQAADPGRLEFAATVDSALAAYLQRLSPVAGLPAAHALTALAFAEAPGLPAALWQLAMEAIYGTRVSDRRPDPVRPVLGGQLPCGNWTAIASRPSRGPVRRCTGCSTRRSTMPCCALGLISLHGPMMSGHSRERSWRTAG